MLFYTACLQQQPTTSACGLLLPQPPPPAPTFTFSGSRCHCFHLQPSPPLPPPLVVASVLACNFRLLPKTPPPLTASASSCSHRFRDARILVLSPFSPSTRRRRIVR